MEQREGKKEAADILQELAAENTPIDPEEYAELGQRLSREAMRGETARLLLKKGRAVTGYVDKMYDVFISCARVLEEECGAEACVGLLAEFLKEKAQAELEQAQINAMLEVLIAKAKKLGDDWKSKGAVGAKEEELAKARALRGEPAGDGGKNEELDGFFACMSEEFIGALAEKAGGLNCRSLFYGEWEELSAPNLQIDYLVLCFSLIEEYVSFSVMYGKEVRGRAPLENLTSASYRVFLEIIPSLQFSDVELELVLCLNFSLCISILLRGSALSDCFALFSQEGVASISAKNILYVQSSVLKSLGMLHLKHGTSTLLDIIYSFFTTGCLDTYDAPLRKSLLEKAVEVLTRSVNYKKIYRLIRKIIYAHESAAQNSEGTAYMISFFLSKLTVKTREDVQEVSNFFTRVISRATNKVELIEPYCSFLSQHDIEIPLHHIIRRHEAQFIVMFYSTYFRHPFTLEKGSRVIGDFINFVNLSDNLEYIHVMNLIPFVPTSPFLLHKVFLIYKRVYACANMFMNGIDAELLYFRLKTPALVGIAAFIFNDPQPTIRKSVLQKMAKALGLEAHLNEDYIVFLTVLYSTETVKLENYNFRGVLEYIKDEITLKYFGGHLCAVIKKVHEGIAFASKDFSVSYACELLKIAASPDSYPLSHRVIVAILQTLFSTQSEISFSEEVHLRFRKCFDSFRKHGFSLDSNKETLREFACLYGKILAQMKEEVSEVYNYIVLNVVDLGLFHALPVMRDERGIKGLLVRSRMIMSMIRDFPTEAMQGSSVWEWLYNKCVSASPESSDEDIPAGPGGAAGGNYDYLLYAVNPEWMRDLIRVRGETPGIIENVRSYLKWILSEEYSLETLLILLEVCNKEERKELLKGAVQRGLDFREDVSTYKKLFELSRGTFCECVLGKMYNFLCKLHGHKDRVKFREMKEQELYDLSTDELVWLSEECPGRKITEMLMKKQVVRCGGFFIDVNKMSVIDALAVIGGSDDEAEVGMAIDRLRQEETRGKGMSFYVPQIAQLLRKKVRKDEGEVKAALLRTIRGRTTHALIWELRAQNDPDALLKYERAVLAGMTAEERGEFDRVSRFLDLFTEISGKLKKYVHVSKEEKRILINREIGKAKVPDDCYLPLSGEQVVGVVEGSGRVLQSAEKVPYMAAFRVLRESAPDKRDSAPASRRDTDLLGRRGADSAGSSHSGGTRLLVERPVIFKFGDDCRQDMLALQLITLFRDIFAQAGIPIFLFPYKVIATSFECGVIEVIPNATSRDQIGRERVNNLVDYFALKYGYKEGKRYTEALKNFVHSFAGYSLAMYVLNIKDRHNGNIMITDDGHLIHIDFGFMFDISPGNINIEGPVKVTDEIFSLLGGYEGGAFKLYKELMIQGFYLLRKRVKDLLLMIELSKDSGLPCYTPATAKNVLARLRLDLKDEELPEFVGKLIASSTKRLRTWIYDQYQHLTNNIAF